MRSGRDHRQPDLRSPQECWSSDSTSVGIRSLVLGLGVGGVVNGACDFERHSAASAIVAAFRGELVAQLAN